MRSCSVSVWSVFTISAAWFMTGFLVGAGALRKKRAAKEEGQRM